MNRHLPYILSVIVLAAGLAPAAPAAGQTAIVGAPDLARIAPLIAAEQKPAAPAAPKKPIVEKVRNGVIVAPEVTFTRVNERHATLVGGTAGVLVDRRLFLGGGGYWLANNSNDLEMWYAGFVGGWYFSPSSVLDLSITGLVGGGQATIGYRFNGPVIMGHDVVGRFGSQLNIQIYPPPASPRYLVDADFYVAEPAATATLRLTRTVAVFGSVRYRLVGGAHSLNDELSGASGSAGIRFGR